MVGTIQNLARGLLWSWLWPMLLVCWAALPVRAQSIQVEATVDSQQTAPGEPITLTITVTGGSPRTPDLPRMPDWRVRYTGQQHSFSSMNFSFTRSTSFNFLLTPLKEGTLTIPALKVQVDGQLFTTRPLEVRVSRGGGGGGLSGDEERPEASDDVIVEVDLEPREVYVGQQVVQRLRIYYATPLAGDIQVPRRPLAGAIEEEVPNQGQRQYTTTMGGRTFRVEEVSWVFYPVSSGTLTVPPLDITVPVVEQSRRSRRNVDPFFDSFMGPMRQVVPRGYRTEEQTITVKPIPTAGCPADFSGLVGTFEARAELSSEQLQAGDSTTLTVTVSGRGNVRNLALPPLNTSDFKAYDDTPAVEVAVGRDGAIVSQKVFKRALVPQQGGELTVPPVTFSYFDPETQRFEQASTREFRIRVTGGAAAEAGSSLTARAGKEAVQVEGEDILPIHQGPQLLKDRFVSFGSPGTVGLLLGPPLLYGLAGAIRRQRMRRDADPVLRRRREALKVALAGLKGLEAGGADDRTQLDRLSRVFRGYLGDKLNREGAALTGGEARRQLEAAGVATEVAAEAERFITRLEEARYAPGGAGGIRSGLKEGARDLLQRLEKELKG